MKNRMTIIAPILGVLALSAAGAAHAVDQYAASTKTCESVVNGDVKRAFSDAKGIEWDWDSVSEHESSNTLTLRGQGSYKGKSGKGRTFDFECEYDTKGSRVSTGWWQSSFDGKRHTIGSGTSTSAPSESDITRACQKAVKDKVSADFQPGVRSLELIQDSIDRTDTRGGQKLSGQGRFQGGGGDWRRFDFTCTWDDDEEVTDTTWRHLGDEKDLDRRSGT